MTFDPYATLGLPRSATGAEIKRAYRRLAKQFHPDAAGQAAMPRFLAIQAAYELLTTGRGGGPGGAGRAAPGPSPDRDAGARPGAGSAERPSGGGWSTWTADPERARATRERFRDAYRERARQAGDAGAGGAAGAGTAGGGPGSDAAGHGGSGRGKSAAGRTGAAGPASTAGPGRKAEASSAGGSSASAGGSSASGAPEGERATGAGPSGGAATGGSAGGSASRPRGRTGRSRRKATLGSTSYDEAAREPFEPGWSGAGWYGATSGTYWTINPREYADPRKHGPEYQARAARAAAAAAGRSADGADPFDPEDGAEAAPQAGAGAGPEVGAASDPASTTKAAAGAGEAEPIQETPRTGGSGEDWSAAWRAAEQRSPGTRANRSGQPGGAIAGGAIAGGGSAGGAATRGAANESRGARPGPAAGSAARSAGMGEGLLDVDLDGLLRRVDPHRPAMTGGGRLVVALLAWFPLAIAVVAAGGELTGCGRAAATCTPGDEIPALLVAAGLFVALLAAASLARVLAHGGLGVLIAAVPAAVVLSISGGPADPPSAALALWILLAAAWLAGVAIGLRRSLGAGAAAGGSGGTR